MMSHSVRHPEEVLRNDFMAPLGLSADALAMALRVPVTRITDITKNDDPRAMTQSTALLLANYFGTMTDFWMNLQVAYDLSRASTNAAAESRAIRRPETGSRLQDL